MDTQTPNPEPRITIEFEGPGGVNPKVTATAINPVQWTMAAAVVDSLARRALESTMTSPAASRILAAVPSMMPPIRER